MEILKKNCLSQWRIIASNVKNSVVFIDNYSAECLHWCGGADLLFEYGAQCIKEFSSFESGKPDQTKGVFILGSPLVGETESIIKDIIQSSSFTKCLLISSLESAVHYFALGIQNPNEDFFPQFTSKVISWIGQDNSSVQTMHLPIFMSPMFDNVFITPAYDMLFPIQDKDLQELAHQKEHHALSLQDLHFYMLPKDYQSLIKMVASSFRNFFHNIQCKEECFALGATSRLLSIQLSNMSNQSKSSYPNKIGVLFIDRTCDLMAPISHSDRTLVDQLLGILPELPCHFNNISIDMSLLCSTKSEHLDDIVYSGCLVPDSKENALLSSSIKKQSTDAIRVVIDKLMEAITDEDLDDQIDIDLDSPDKAETLKSMVEAFKGNPGGILYNSSLLQLGLAIAQLLENPEHKTWQTLARKEKLVLQQLGDEVSTGVIDHLIRLSDEGLEFDNLCSLLMYASYALRNNTDSDVHEKLSQSIAKSLSTMDYDDVPENIISLYNLKEQDMKNQAKLCNIAYRILNSVSEINTNLLKHFKPLRLNDFEPPSYRPLLPQVVERIYDGTKPELEPDIEHVTTGRKDILKMGISMFRKITPPRPNDFPILILYVIGGISTTEIAQVNKILERYPNTNCQLVIGSNRLVSPSDIVDTTLFNNNLNPGGHF